MKTLTWEQLGEEFVVINKEDLKRVEKCFREQVELRYDRRLRVYNEADYYIADLVERENYDEGDYRIDLTKKN